MMKYINLFVLGLLFVSCNENINIKSCVKRYYKELSKYTTTVYDSTVQFSLVYIPNEVVAYNQINQIENNKEKLNDKIKENQSYIFFILEIKDMKKGDSLIFRNEEIKNYLSFDFEKDIYCLNQQDTIYPSNYLYEDYYGLSKTNKINLVFDKKAIKKDGKVELKTKNNILSKSTKIEYRIIPFCKN